MFYGLTRPVQALQMAVDVCQVLGAGKNNAAVKLLIATACQETWLGQYKDRHLYTAGVGVNQFDPIAVIDVQQNTKPDKIQLVIDEFGVDIRDVQLRDLAFSPLLSMIFARLKYLRVPEPIPETIEGMAAYWKKHYNTELGKGTAHEFIDNYRRHGEKLMELLK